MRLCINCGKLKDDSEFYKNKTRSNDRSSYCKDCDRERSRKWYKKNIKRKAMQYQKRLSREGVRERYRGIWRTSWKKKIDKKNELLGVK